MILDMNFDDQGQENGLTASTPRHDLTITENLHTFVRDDTIPPSPTSDDNQSSAATPVEDAVTPDITGAKRKAAMKMSWAMTTPAGKDGGDSD